jgi:hypothetical protein
MDEKYGFVSYSLIKLLLGGCTTCGLSKSMQRIENHRFCLVATLYCTDGHKNIWYSSAQYNNMIVINELIPMSVVLNGRVIKNYIQFFNSNNLVSLAETAYYNRINYCIHPAVNKYFLNKHIPSLVTGLKGERSIIANGRFSSLGHSATKCTISFIDEETNKIIKIVNANIRQYNGISQRMEPSATMKGLNELLNKDKIIIKELITNGHLSIQKSMREKFLGICYQNDLWHKGRTLYKLLQQIKYKKICLPDIWIALICCYMYRCLKNSKGDLITYNTLWESFTKDISDSYKDHKYKNHYPCNSKLKKNKGLITELHNAMKRFAKDFNYYINYRITSKIESFNNVILKYMLKCIPF